MDKTIKPMRFIVMQKTMDGDISGREGAVYEIIAKTFPSDATLDEAQRWALKQPGAVGNLMITPDQNSWISGTDNLVKKDQFCQWKRFTSEDDYIVVGCKHGHEVRIETMEDGYMYCPWCGREIENV